MRGFESFPFPRSLESSSPLIRPTPCPLADEISPTDTHEDKTLWPFRHMKREPGSFRRAQVQEYQFGTISRPLPHPHAALLWGFGRRVSVRTLTQAAIRAVPGLNLIVRCLVRAFMSTWGFQAFTINAKQAFVGPWKDMSLIMFAQCEPEEIDIPRSLNPWAAAIQEQAGNCRWGSCTTGHCEQLDIPSTQTCPPTN